MGLPARRFLREAVSPLIRRRNVDRIPFATGNGGGYRTEASEEREDSQLTAAPDGNDPRELMDEPGDHARKLVRRREYLAITGEAVVYA